MFNAIKKWGEEQWNSIPPILKEAPKPSVIDHLTDDQRKKLMSMVPGGSEKVNLPDGQGFTVTAR